VDALLVFYALDSSDFVVVAVVVVGVVVIVVVAYVVSPFVELILQLQGVVRTTPKNHLF
jgi:hypothetical protein